MSEQNIDSEPLYHINEINRKLLLMRGLLSLLIHEGKKQEGYKLIEDICDNLSNLTVMAHAGKLRKVKIE